MNAMNILFVLPTDVNETSNHQATQGREEGNGGLRLKHKLFEMTKRQNKMNNSETSKTDSSEHMRISRKNNTNATNVFKV